ncbi:MAG: hypothetical protein CVU11_06480 [Bacteroidetes bacterium HGW-Bacteroidetes-6]|jgi:hypothetical protein|nr:MAG: hypothetical protein CVU11_06480 [Bacteroidetes bacterium HGW-Bacteroidetes-6]
MNAFLRLVLLIIMFGFRYAGSQIMINWINMDGVSIDTLGVLVNEQTDSSYTYGAESQNILKFNEDGYVSYSVNQTGKTRMLGLKKLPYATSFSSTSVSYGFKISYTNQLYRVKKGSADLLIDTVSAGDLLKVSRTGDSIYYYVNDVEKDKLYYNNDTNMTAVAVIYSSGGKLEYAQCNFIPSVVDSFDLSVDARIKSNIPTTPGGSDTYITASHSLIRPSPNVRSLIKLPMDSIPADVEIVEAKLLLFGSAHSGSNASYLQRVTSNWDESTVTWDTQPSAVTDNQISLSQTASTNENKEIDVTTFTTLWYTGAYDDYGFLLIKQNESTLGVMNFGSSDNTTASLRPVLQVVYRKKPKYSKLYEQLDGSYYQSISKRVGVQFIEEYYPATTKKLEYKVYDDAMNLVAAVDAQGVPSGSGVAVVSVSHGDNRILLDFSAVSGMSSGEYYILEVSNSKNELTYLRFKL